MIMEENMIVTRDPKAFCFNFDWPNYVDESLKHETEFIIKSNEALAENKIKNDIEQLLVKYKHGNNINEHQKQQASEPHQIALNLQQRLDVRSLGNVNKYEFLTDKDVLLEKDLLEKAATIKRFECFPLARELKAQTDIVNKQYQKLDDNFRVDKIIKNKN